MSDLGLGRVYTPDPRDDLFTMESLLPEVVTGLPPSRYYSTPGMPLNQGATPMCVGYATRGLLNAGPVSNMGGPDAPTIYHNAQLLDGIPGTAYDGTNDRGSMKYLQSLGYITSYVWTRSAQTAMNWILSGRGCLLIGINWYSSFDNPGASATLRITPTAHVRGGHEVLLIGANQTNGLFRGINSWGSNWGQNGRFWLPAEVLQRLINEQGDVCTPSEILKVS